MRPNIIVKLTPDALALLQIIGSKSIAFEEMGIATNGNGHSHAPTHEPRGSGRRTTNGVAFKVYRKKQHMDEHAALAAGTKPLRSFLEGRPIGKVHQTMLQNMRTEPAVAGGKVKIMPRSTALKLITTMYPKKTKSAASAMISRLYKLGALRVVL